MQVDTQQVMDMYIISSTVSLYQLHIWVSYPNPLPLHQKKCQCVTCYYVQAITLNPSSRAAKQPTKLCAHSHVRTPTKYTIKQGQNSYLHRLYERNQSKGPEAAEKGEEGETEVVFSRRPGLQRDKIYVFVHTRSNI